MSNSLIKNMINMVFKNKESKKVKNLKPSKARIMQKKYLEQTCDDGSISSAAYTEIAKQLEHQKSEIFKAAVFYLEQIALNENKLSADILTILQNYNAVNKRSQEDRNYLQNAINELKSANIK